ncbi:MAG: hypothetical protein IJ419_04005 [Agathobacter sp.]|nr:hypothetical protein [Agathobacter sp.]
METEDKRKFIFRFFLMRGEASFSNGMKLTDMYDGVKIMKNRAYNVVTFIT